MESQSAHHHLNPTAGEFTPMINSELRASAAEFIPGCTSGGLPLPTLLHSRGITPAGAHTDGCDANPRNVEGY